MISRYLFYFLSAICFGLLLFTNLGMHQLEFYDEARRGVNALEMFNGQAHWLVPTYGGLPDHWGTKPPLLIWLQVAGFYLFGIGEFALRFPAALATSLAIILMIWFTKRQWDKPAIGMLAGWITLMNWNFIGNHGARSGDYDALLLLFSLGQILFFARLVNTSKYRYLLLSALSLLLAGWTKGIAGCFLLPAIALYVILTPEGRKYLLDWRMYCSYALSLAGIISYYLLREQYDPGYLQIVYENELGGRYLAANEGHPEPVYHYLWVLFRDQTFGLFAQLFLPAFVVIVVLRKRFPGSLLIGMGAIVFLAVLSSSATKLFWYVVPSLPLIGLSVAVLLYQCWEWLTEQVKLSVFRNQLLAGLLFLAIFLPLTAILLDKVSRPGDFIGKQAALSSYRAVLESDTILPPYTLMPYHYHAPARFYAFKERLKGKDIHYQPATRLTPPLLAAASDYAKLTIGQRVLICEGKPWRWMDENYHYRLLQRQQSCTLIEIAAYREGIDARHLPED